MSSVLSGKLFDGRASVPVAPFFIFFGLLAEGEYVVAPGYLPVW